MCDFSVNTVLSTFHEVTIFATKTKIVSIHQKNENTKSKCNSPPAPNQNTTHQSNTKNRCASMCVGSLLINKAFAKKVYTCFDIALFPSVISKPRYCFNFRHFRFDPLQYTLTPPFTSDNCSTPFCLYRNDTALWTAL